MAVKTKTKKVPRTRMSDLEVEKYLKHFSKEHDLKGKELDHAVRRCAATRWAALERNAKKVVKKAIKKAKGGKK